MCVFIASINKPQLDSDSSAAKLEIEPILRLLKLIFRMAQRALSVAKNHFTLTFQVKNVSAPLKNDFHLGKEIR
jgi:hypothetical protein